MKNWILTLVLLLVLCISLPIIFNVKYNENFATYPSRTDKSFREGMETPLQKKHYSSYEKKIDINLRNKGHSISDHMRKNEPEGDDNFKKTLDRKVSLIDYLINLYRNNKEAFTTTQTLTDLSNNITYDILPNQELYNIDGELKLGAHDSTDYASLLETIKKEFVELQKLYDSSNYLTKTDVSEAINNLTNKLSSTLNSNTTNGSFSSMDSAGGMNNELFPDNDLSMNTGPTGGMDSGLPSNMNTGPTGGMDSGLPSNMNTGIISNMNSGLTSVIGSGTIDTTTNSGVEPTPVNTGTMSQAKCIANFGTNIGDPLCCGQGGTLESTKYTCPSNLPTCTGYKCGSNFGTCS